MRIIIAGALVAMKVVRATLRVLISVALFGGVGAAVYFWMTKYSRARKSQ